VRKTFPDVKKEKQSGESSLVKHAGKLNFSIFDFSLFFALYFKLISTKGQDGTFNIHKRGSQTNGRVINMQRETSTSTHDNKNGSKKIVDSKNH
jgi:hypothetical protein